MEYTKTLEILIPLIGSSGLIWVVWSKFGQSIKEFFNLKTTIKKGELDIEEQETNVLENYRKFIDRELAVIMQKYKNLELKVEEERIKNQEAEIKYEKEIAELYEKIRETEVRNDDFIAKQTTYIVYLSNLLKMSNIPHKPFDYE